MRITITHTAMLTVLTFALASCVRADSKTGARGESTTGAPAQSAAAAKAADAPKETWRSLLETKTAKGWRGWASPDLPKGWKVTEGVISKDGEVDDLVTREEFANFELNSSGSSARAATAASSTAARASTITSTGARRNINCSMTPTHRTVAAA